jgi:hypothetical protein
LILSLAIRGRPERARRDIYGIKGQQQLTQAVLGALVNIPLTGTRCRRTATTPSALRVVVLGVGDVPELVLPVGPAGEPDAHLVHIRPMPAPTWSMVAQFRGHEGRLQSGINVCHRTTTASG